MAQDMRHGRLRHGTLRHGMLRHGTCMQTRQRRKHSMGLRFASIIALKFWFYKNFKLMHLSFLLLNRDAGEVNSPIVENKKSNLPSHLWILQRKALTPFLRSALGPCFPFIPASPSLIRNLSLNKRLHRYALLQPVTEATGCSNWIKIVALGVSLLSDGSMRFRLSSSCSTANETCKGTSYQHT